MYHQKFEVGSEYTRKQVADVVGDPRIASWPKAQGLAYLPGTTILFVTLDKRDMDVDYNDYFIGNLFRWETQTGQSRESPEIVAIQNGIVETILFCRISKMVRGKTRPHTYCGRLKWRNAFDKHPAKVNFLSLDYVEAAKGSLAEIYAWQPADVDEIKGDP
jgi:hypothetical protein